MSLRSFSGFLFVVVYLSRFRDFSLCNFFCPARCPGLCFASWSPFQFFFRKTTPNGLPQATSHFSFCIGAFLFILRFSSVVFSALWIFVPTPLFLLQLYSGFHFLCSKLWTVADASSFALKLCRMLEKICRGVPSSPISKRIKKGSSFPRKSAQFISPFAGATLGCYNVTNPQFTLDLLTCRAPPMGYNSVQFRPSVQPSFPFSLVLAVIRLAFTDKIRPTGREMLLCLCWLLFQKLTAVKQAKFAAAKNFYGCAYARLVCYAIARFLAAWWKFVCRTRLYPIFPKHFVLFVWFYLERRL